MSNPVITYITPVTKEGEPDNRFSTSIERIIKELDEETIEELRQFARDTAVIQRRAASAGLLLATAVFREAAYLDKHHRFDEDNKFGWRSKTLRKQAQQILEQIGFKRNNAHKLVTAASWLTSKNFCNKEQKWLGSLTPSHIYELSRMSDEGYARVKQGVQYHGFGFTAGQQEITVRTLESLRRQFPHKKVQQIEEVDSESQEEVVENSSEEVFVELHLLQPTTNSGDNSNEELIEQFTQLVQTIDWSVISTENRSRQLLATIEDTLRFIAALAHEPLYSPVMSERLHSSLKRCA
jgi:hypothetical protein